MKIKKLLSKKFLVVVLVVVLLLMQYFQLLRVSNSVEVLRDRDSSLITEIGQIKDTYLSFGQDLNEVRGFLLLPTKDYLSFDDLEESEEDDTNSDVSKNEDDVQLALFQYVDYVAVNKKNEEALEIKKEILVNVVNSESFNTFVSSVDLSIDILQEDSASMSLAIINEAGENIVLYYLSKEDGTLFVKTALDKSEVEVESAEQFEKDATSYITANKEGIMQQMAGIKESTAKITAAIESAGVQDSAASISLTIDSQYREEDLKAHYAINNKSDETVGDIVLDLKTAEITLVDMSDESNTLIVTDVATALPPFLEKLDTQDVIQKKVADAQRQVEETIADEGFKLLLSESGLTIAVEPRLYDERLFYDISDADGNLVSSIVVETTTAVINIVDSEGTNSQNLLFFDPEVKKKTLEIPDNIPDYGDELSSDDDTFNILIAGKHGNLVDTMIFAHIDEKRKDVRMISIPRDLHYNGRKINAFAYFYGMPELQRVLGELTGYKVDKYVLIDMYAFIDVVDLIGGVDVTLEKPVIDPTYRTVDDGVVGTLHYEPGTYHLGGKEALRLARSRHTSSDFARAERQQLILESLQLKAKNFGFGDADTFYEIAKTVLNKTDTDISLDEAIAYYFRYQNYDIKSNDVMSSGNVLYVPPYITKEQCSSLIAAAAAAGQGRPGCEAENHAYTLLPRDNNWNVVKWFFKEKFEVPSA